MMLLVQVPEIIWWWWCKPIFVSNPTEVKVGLVRLELSWGCDNIIQMLEITSILKPCQANQTKPAKPNKAKFKVTFAPIFILTCIVTPKNSTYLSLGIVILPRPN